MKDQFGDGLKSDEFQNENESKEAHAAAKRKRTETSKFEADHPGAYLAGFKEWKEIRAQWANATEDERLDLIYGIAFLNGGKPKDVAKAFAIKVEDLKPYTQIFEQASAVLKLKVQGHQIRWAFSTNQPHAKFFVGKQFAQQVENPAHDDVDSLDDARNTPTMTVNVLSKPVQSAVAQFDQDDDEDYGSATLQ